MKSVEHTEQVMLMQWWALACRQLGIAEQLLFAIPNGGKRNVIVASKLKAEGVRAGVPDLFLAVAQGDYHGLFVELKKPKGGRVSDSQRTFHPLLTERGYAVAVAHGWIAAKQVILEYLKGTWTYRDQA